MANDRVTLAQAIHDLREQLMEATRGGEGQALRFVPKTVEVELGITLNVEKEGGGGIKLWSILDLSGKAKQADGASHKIKLVLEPVGPDGGPALISDTVLEK